MTGDQLIALAALLIGCALAWFGRHHYWYERAKRMASCRPDLSRGDFIAALQPEVDPETSAWFWELISPFYPRPFTPHPDDHPLQCLNIDAFDPDDWTEDFCQAHGLPPDRIAPIDTVDPATIRNMLEYLVTCRKASQGQR